MMMKQFLLCIAVACTGFLTGCSSLPFYGANRLHRQALKNEKTMLETATYQEAFNAHSATMRDIELISSRYPDSDLCRQIESGTFLISGMDLSEFKALGSALFPLAEAERDPTACALFLAESSEKKTEHASSMIAIALFFAEHEMLDTSSNILEQAGVLIESMGPDEDSADLWVQFAAAHMKYGGMNACSNALEKAVEMATTATNSVSSIHTLVRIAQTYDELGQSQNSSSLMHLALNKASQLKPEIDEDRDMLSYSLFWVTTWCVNHDETSHADQALSIIRELIDSLEDPREPSFIANRFADEGLYEIAIGLLDSIKGAPDVSFCVRRIAESCTNEAILIQIRDKVQRLEDDFDRGNLLFAITKQFIEQGRFAQAVETAASITNEFTFIIPWPMIAHRYAELGDYPRAIYMTGQIRDRTQRAVAQTEVAVLLEKRGKKKESEAAIAIALESIDHDLYGFNKCRTLCAMAEKLAEYDQVAKALALLDQARQWSEFKSSAFIKSSDLTRIAGQYTRNGNPDLAKELLAEAALLSEEIDEDAYRSSAVADIARGYVEAGMLSRAFELVNTVALDDDDNRRFLNDAAKRCSETNTFHLIIEMYPTVEDEHDRDSILEDLTEACLEHDMIEEALQSAKAISYKYKKDDAIVTVCSAYADAGEYDKAIETTDLIDTDYMKANELVSIAHKCVEATRFELFIKAVVKIDSPHKQSLAVADIACALKGSPEHTASLDLAPIVQTRFPVQAFWQ